MLNIQWRHQGCMRGHLPPPWRFCPPPTLAPTPRWKKNMSKISHFWQIFEFLPPQTHIFAPQCPPEQVSGAATVNNTYSSFNCIAIVFFSTVSEMSTQQKTQLIDISADITLLVLGKVGLTWYKVVTQACRLLSACHTALGDPSTLSQVSHLYLRGDNCML